jgi:ABC-type lipoprotein export system ATPase subunit
LAEVSFSLEAHEVAWISSPSGGGKTTLLNILGLLASPDSGSYSLDGADLTRLDSRARTALRATAFSTIFQRGNLFGHLNALENVQLGLRSGAARPARSALRTCGLDKVRHRRAGLLSGGEQQRVSIARAIARSSKVILADEPTSSLDDGNTAIVLDMLSSAARSGTVVVIASHDSRVGSIAARHLSLENGRIA